MSMHLHHPSLSLNGKKKGKVKYRSAEHAQKERELKMEWENLTKKHQETSKPKTSNRLMNSPKKYSLTIPRGRGTDHIPTVDSGHLGAVTVKQTQKYTGDKLLGIGVMHKSNLVPIFNGDDAIAISKMRRG